MAWLIDSGVPDAPDLDYQRNRLIAEFSIFGGTKNPVSEKAVEKIAQDEQQLAAIFPIQCNAEKFRLVQAKRLQLIFRNAMFPQPTQQFITINSSAAKRCTTRRFGISKLINIEIQNGSCRRLAVEIGNFFGMF